ncbi:MAG TPA: hypothetical protein VIX86_25025 [Streptosporangiaceae bacterium]
MSHHERAALARALAEMEGPRLVAPLLAGPILAGGGHAQWRRRLLIGAALGCTVALAAWVGWLVVTLPPGYRAGGWSAAWVGFDIVLLAVFAATAWAAWRRRQMLILCLVVLATLLLCDAWFDTTLDYATRDFTFSLLLALGVELPLALVALIGARRLLRLTLGRLEALEGITEPVPAFWKVPMFTDETAGSGYLDVFRPASELDSAPGDQASAHQEA